MTTTKRLVSSGIATGLWKTVLAIQHIVLVPFFISSWGSEYYGEWLTISAIPTAFALSDLGLGTAIINSFAISYASGDTQKAANYLKTGTILISLITTLFVSVFLLLAIGLYSSEFVPKMHMRHEVIAITVSLLTLSRFIGFYDALNQAYFRAASRVPQWIYIAVSILTFRILASIAILLAGGNAIELAAADVTISVVSLSVNRWLGLRTLPNLPTGETIKDAAELGAIIRKSFAYMLNPVRNALSIQGTLLIVRIWFGAESVTIFNSIRIFCNSVHHVLSSINISILPELQMAIAQQNMVKAQKIYVFAVGLSLLSGFTVAILLWLFGTKLFDIWTLARFELPFLLWELFLLTVLIRATWWTASVVFTATNNPEGFAVVALLIAIIGISISVALAPVWGIVGVTTGLVIAEFLTACWVIPKSAKILNMATQTLWHKVKFCLLDLTQQNHSKSGRSNNP